MPSGAECDWMRSAGTTARAQIPPLPSTPRILMLSDVRVWPAVERTGAHVGDVVRHEVFAQAVAFVDGGPERARLRIPVHPDRIAESSRKDAFAAAVGIEFEDRRALWRLAGADVRRGPDTH